MVPSLIDVTSMPDSDYYNQQHSVIDGVDDSVIANPKAIAISSSKGPRGRRARILSEECYRPLNSRLRRTIYLAKFSKCSWPKFNSVLAHGQPRSLFTCSHGMLPPSSVSAASNAITSSDSSSASSIWS